MNKTTISDPGEVRDMYDSQAEDYSTMMDGEIKQPLYAATLDRLRSQIAGLSGAIVDAPCGSGHMLAMYHDDYDSERALVGVDLSPHMVEVAAKRLGDAAELVVGDIRELETVPSESAAAVISYFAFHHLDIDGVMQAVAEWHRALQVGGRLFIGAWEGTGLLDYGDASDIVAFLHEAGDLQRVIRDCGFSISRNVVEADAEMGMNMVFIEGTRD